jgi:hypothetical protein
MNANGVPSNSPGLRGTSYRRRNFFSVKAFQAEWKERLFGEL